jgi:phosphoglycolate phosphatase-like HAD superfamily hydrolase
MTYVVFDLDGTVIDSSHRHLAKPDGSVDLEHWFDNATPEKIALDGLLPLADSMRAIHRAGHRVIICTSRSFQPADLKFLEDNDLPYHHLFSRPGFFVGRDDPRYADSYFGFIGDARSDELIKAEQLAEFFRSEGFESIADAPAIMYDDNLKVIRKMNEIGLPCLNAVNVNAQILRNAA